MYFSRIYSHRSHLHAFSQTLWKRSLNFQNFKPFRISLSFVWCPRLSLLHSLFTLYVKKKSFFSFYHFLNMLFAFLPYIVLWATSENKETFFCLCHVGSDVYICDFLNSPGPWKTIPNVSSLSASRPFLESPSLHSVLSSAPPKHRSHFIDD